MTVSSRPPRLNMFRRTIAYNSSKNQLAKSAQSSNVILNIEKLGIDQYCAFQQEHYLEKTCPQWNQAMSMISMQLVDSIMAKE